MQDERPLDIEALRNGDAREFARLVDAHASLVAGACQAMGLRGADADDAAAIAFAAVYKSLKGFQERSKLSTWVYCIALRQAMHVRKQRGRTRVREQSYDAFDSAPPLADARQDAPDTAAQKHEQNDRLWKIVNDLEPRQAVAVDLFYRQGFDINAIAEVMACPTNTVKTHLSRARERLRGLLTHEGMNV